MRHISRLICRLFGHTQWRIGQRRCERCDTWLLPPLAAGERLQDQFELDSAEPLAPDPTTSVTNDPAVVTGRGTYQAPGVVAGSRAADETTD